MRVIHYSAKNVMGISEIDVDMEGQHLILVGGDNEQGKTSALTALLMALCGRRDMNWPDVALKEGEDEGWVRVNLSGDEELHDSLGFNLELLLSRKRGGQVVEKFRLTDSAGEDAPEPRTLLKRLYHYRGFDPLDFARKTKGEQRRLLMDLCGLDFQSDEQAAKELYDKRTDVNRDLKKARAEADTAVTHTGVPTKEVDTAELMEKLTARQEYNATTRKIKADMEAQIKESDRIQKDIQAENAEIEALKKEIAQRQAAIVALDGEATKSHDAWNKLNKQLAGREEKDVEAIRTEIKEAGATNKKIAENAKAKSARDKAISLNRESDTLSAKMDEIKADQQARLKAAEWPVPGLSIDDDGVLFEGLPFEQASAMRRTIVSAQIGMSLNPKLRLLVCQGGGDLGNAALDALSNLCKERDFQMVVEIVTRSKEDEDRCAVVIENGKVKAAT